MTTTILGYQILKSSKYYLYKPPSTCSSNPFFWRSSLSSPRLSLAMARTAVEELHCEGESSLQYGEGNRAIFVSKNKCLENPHDCPCVPEQMAHFLEGELLNCELYRPRPNLQSLTWSTCRFGRHSVLRYHPRFPSPLPLALSTSASPFIYEFPLAAQVLLSRYNDHSTSGQLL